MWNRFKRWARSVFGGAITAVEDPEKILQQNIRDMNDQIPRMNEALVMIAANATLIENRQKDRQAKIDRLTANIKTALQAGKREIALNYTTQLQQLRDDLGNEEQQLRVAREAYQKALKVKEAFLQEKRHKIEEVQRAVAKHKQTEWQRKVADAMETFEVAGIDATHDEMIERINQEAAQNQARMEMALGNIDAEGLELEKEARQLEADQMLRQFEMEMGLTPPEAVGEKTLGPGAARVESTESAAEPVTKTVGPKKVLE